MSADQIKAAEASARAALVRATALSAITESGFSMPELLLPVVEGELRAISPGSDSPLMVVAVDEHGSVRTGQRGAMDAHELVARLKTDPRFISGWKK